MSTEIMDELSCCCSGSEDESFCGMDDEDSLEGFYSSDDDDEMSHHAGACDESHSEAFKSETVTPISALRLLMDALYSNSEDFTTLHLSVPIQYHYDFVQLLHAIRYNWTVTHCSLDSICYQSLSPPQRRELAYTLCAMPHLKALTLDTVFPEFLYACNYCRCYQRDMYYRQYQRFCEFENQTVEEIQITHVPSNITEGLLGHLVMMTLSNFGTLKRLEVAFAEDDSDDDVTVTAQAILMRVALTALSCSNSLFDIKLGSLEVDATRSHNILKVLKLRCSDQQLSERSYMELAHMLHIHSRTLKGLVLDTAVDQLGALAIANTLGQQKSNIKALCLGTFDCQDEARRDGLLSLVERVLGPGQSSLEYLSLVCQELDDSGLHQFAKILSQSSLRELMLFLDNQDDTTANISSLADALQINKTLEEFSLICNTLNDEAVMALAAALQMNNRTLKALNLQSSGNLCVTTAGYKAILQILESNTTLESIEISRSQDSLDEMDCDETTLESEAVYQEYKPRMDYYLNLNKAGVRNLHLGTTATPKQFLGKVISQRDELNTVFHMLSMNPSFIEFGV